MQRTVKFIPTDRDRWLAELSWALGEAQQLLFDMDLCAFGRVEAGGLFHQIQAAQFEIRTLQLSRSEPAEEKSPIWT